MDDQQECKIAGAANRLPALFSINNAVQLDEAEWVFKDCCRGGEIDAVLALVGFVF